ncbi:Mannosyl-glycoprotein endo-beta-N-acetylglucosaminidase [Rubritalea squalenifaciens DSM 18772]|uniref:Mannosyl-glycoprotein endo-beta-N-acetylglucosaminidase n=1 Tax=Rubritalea squalenifaciens DSM 18772 TaxID=1123071 RepID=A0A1M6CRV1_9BACT|nr:glucosaminidase domain-containing protein [Rubritalea squalenifaciens]SHI63571.1 Mannosyl-glycoprotein endo-beta-N-acetylglucosaminidase [Rubritalea squalenifaciens DSM 18772]
MIIIPKTKLLNPAGGTPLTNPANAGAVHQAAAQVGEQISQIGESAFGHQVQLQRIRNDNDLANKQADLRTMLGDFDNTLPTDHDPSTWVQRREKFINNAVAKLGVDQLPPEARDKWDRWYVDYSTDSQLKTARDATVYGIQLAKRDGQLRHEKYMASGDFELARENALRMRDNGTIAPQAADEVLYAIDRGERDFEIKLAQEKNPRELKERLLKGDWEMNDLERERLLDLTNKAIASESRECGASIIDDIYSGKISSTEEIEKAAGGRMRPSDLVKLQGTLEQYQNELYNQYISSPEQQSRIIGQVSSMIADYDARNLGDDDNYVAIKTQLELVQNKHLKKQLADRLDGMIGDEEDRIKSVSDFAFDLIDKHYKTGGFGGGGKIKMDQTTAYQAINNGHFFSEDNLQAFGFSEDDIDNIMDAKIDAGAIWGSDERGTLNAKLDMFKKLWDSRENESTAGEWYDSLAEHVMSGRGLYTVFYEKEDPASRQDYDRQQEAALIAHGRMRAEMAAWLEMNPDAKSENVISKVKELRVDAESYTETATFGSSRPSREAEGEGFQKTSSVDLPKPMQGLQASFDEYGQKYGVNPVFLAAIARLETANGTSSAFRNKNNAMGVSNSKGPISFSDASASVERMARVLSDPNGPYKGATTIGQIARIYAPPGAGNDYNGTNGYWPKGVIKYMKEMGVKNPEKLKVVSR